MVDKTVEKIAKVLYQWLHPAGTRWESKKLPETVRVGYRKRAEVMKQLFLSDPNIVEIDREAELPINRYKELKDLGDAPWWIAYENAQEDMLDAGWVKKVGGNSG